MRERADECMVDLGDRSDQLVFSAGQQRHRSHQERGGAGGGEWAVGVVLAMVVMVVMVVMVMVMVVMMMVMVIDESGVSAKVKGRAMVTCTVGVTWAS